MGPGIDALAGVMPSAIQNGRGEPRICQTGTPRAGSGLNLTHHRCLVRINGLILPPKWTGTRNEPLPFLDPAAAGAPSAVVGYVLTCTAGIFAYKNCQPCAEHISIA